MPSPPASASPSPPPPAGSPLGVANGINGGSGVNAYMQHFQAQQQQQAALYGQQQQQQSAQASAYGYSSARPPSGSPIRSHLPKSAGSARGAGTIATPKYARAVSRGGRAAAQQQQLAATMPYGGSTTYRAAADASATLGVSGGMLAVGPATGRPMTSRITGSTGGVSHRLYLPPQEKAAQELATAAGMAAAAASAAANLSRPSSGTGTRPSSGYHMSRPGTSHHNRGGGAARPPSAAAGLVGLGLGAGGLGVGMGGGGALGVSAGLGGSSNSTATAGSIFSPQLSAMSFKPARAILDELQRVLAINGLQCTLLPPSQSASASGGKAAFGAGSNALAISVLRSPDDSSAFQQQQQHYVLECRQGSHRFQFHVTPLNSAAARLAMDLDGGAADGRPTSAAGGAPLGGQSYSVRVKRVLGDAQTFRDLCAKLLPQLKL